MIIQVNSKIKDPRVTKPSTVCDESELKQAFAEIIKERQETDCQVSWLDDGTVEVAGMSPLTLHSFVLKAEALGKDIEYEKKTIIHIS